MQNINCYKYCYIKRHQKVKSVRKWVFRRNKIWKKNWPWLGLRSPPPTNFVDCNSIRFMIFFLLKSVNFMYDHQWHDNMCYDVKSGCIDWPSTIEIANYGNREGWDFVWQCKGKGGGGVKMLLYIFRSTHFIITIVSFLSWRFYLNTQISTVSLISNLLPTYKKNLCAIFFKYQRGL